MDTMTVLFLLTILALGLMMFLGKVYDQGCPTDRERLIYSNGPECDENENLAEICSPFEYEPERIIKIKTVEQPHLGSKEVNIPTTSQNIAPQIMETEKPELREVQLNNFIKNKVSKTK